jgi:hypothetical protein
MPDFASIGVEVMKSVTEYCYLLKSIEFELKISGGWLKPIRLKQLTGMLAQDRLERQIEENRKRNRNFILRSKIQPEVGSSEDWRAYFTEEELQIAFKRIQNGEEEAESETSGSESEPSEDNIAEVIILEEKKEPTKVQSSPRVTVSASLVRPSDSIGRSATSNWRGQKKTPDVRPKKKERKSEQAYYPHTSRAGLNQLEDSIRPQTSSKLFSYRDSRSGRNTPGLSPIIFNTFKRNLGFYQQMLATRANIANGSLEITCTKLKTKKYSK